MTLNGFKIAPSKVNCLEIDKGALSVYTKCFDLKMSAFRYYSFAKSKYSKLTSNSLPINFRHQIKLHAT